MFTGEMVFPWMFDDFASLAPFKGAAELLAAQKAWPPLYDTAALQENKVPVAAAVYLEVRCCVYHACVWQSPSCCTVCVLQLWLREQGPSGCRNVPRGTP